jgi:hypothetical protein
MKMRQVVVVLALVGVGVFNSCPSNDSKRESKVQNFEKENI